MTIAEKLTTVAENVEKVYEAGFKKGSESGGATADTREIYQGTRPLEWLRMPDYDKLDGKSFYVLFHILPYGDNILSFFMRFAGNVIIEYGSCKGGVFVPDPEFGQDVLPGTADQLFIKEFNYDDWGKYQLSNGRRQILIRFHFPNGVSRINIHPNYSKVNFEIKEILCDCDIFDQCFELYAGTDRCDYFYITKAMTSNEFPSGIPAKYVQREEGTFSTGVNSGYSGNVIKVLNPFKATLYGELLRGCTNLEEVTIDISEVTSWGNVFRGSCKNLRRVIFIGGENLTSFPGDINLNPSSLNVDGVREFFNTLPDITPSGTVRTITLTNSPAATAGIPEDVLSIATTKGWTVTT